MFRRILKRLLTGAKEENGTEPDDRGLSDALAAEQQVYRQGEEVQNSNPVFDTKLENAKKRISGTRFKRKEATG